MKHHTVSRDSTTVRRIELIIILALAIVVLVLAGKYDIMESITIFLKKNETDELDEIIIMSLYLLISLIYYLTRLWYRLLKSENDLLNKNKELEKAFSEIKQLRGLVPICSSCKKNQG